MRKIIYFSLIYLLTLYSNSLAQTNSNARGLSLAHAYTALARGVAAPYWNPANLALPDHPSVSVQLVGAGFRAGNLTFSKSMYDEYNGKYLTSSDVDHILSQIQNDGFELIADSDVQALGFSVGSFALTFSGCAASNLSLSKDFLRILLEGIYIDENYNIRDNLGEAIGFSSISASYAFPINLPVLSQLYFGTNVSYLIGLGYAEVLESYGQLHHGGWEVNGEGRVRARYAQGGAGFAFDFGFAKIKHGWNIGIMLKNAISKMNWTTKPEEFEAHFFAEHGITIENASDEDTLDSILKTCDETREINSFSNSLPAELRFGIAKKIRSFLVSMDYHQGFTRRPGISTKPYIALSSEWQGIGFFPWRLGLGFGGDHGILMATGFGFKLGFFRLDYGISFLGSLRPSGANSLGMGLSTSFVF